MQPVSLPTLDGLADSGQFAGPLEISGENREWLLKALADMILIRLCEQKIAEMINENRVKCPAHLGVGQEAIAVGVARELRRTDRAFGTHRSHSHYLAMGGSVDELFGEVLGKETGCSKGMGGSMHLQAKQVGFLGSVPIVGATISMAVGAALAAKLDRSKSGSDIGLAFFGDGSTEEGTFHESLNIAAVYKLPVLFVCENNFFSSHLHISLRQPSSCISRFAAASSIPFEVVDGNDVVAVRQASARLIKKMREGGGPGFLEATTFRWLGHVGPREDIDVGVERKRDDVEKWRARDPVRRLKDALAAEGLIDDAGYQRLTARLAEQVKAAAVAAENAPYPDLSRLMSLVYKGDK